MTERVGFHQLAPESFPFTAELVRLTDGTVAWSAVIEEPGAIRIPALGPGHRARLTFADGTVVEAGAP